MSQYAFLPEKNPNLRVGFFPAQPRLFFFFHHPEAVAVQVVVKIFPESVAVSNRRCAVVAWSVVARPNGGPASKTPASIRGRQENYSMYCRPQVANKTEKSEKWRPRKNAEIAS